MLLKPLPYTDADRIVMVMEKPPQGERNGISTLNYLDWKAQNKVFEFTTAFRYSRLFQERQSWSGLAWEVVGVVADERVTDLDNKRDHPGIYVTNDQSPVYFGGVVVRASMNPVVSSERIAKCCVPGQ